MAKGKIKAKPSSNDNDESSVDSTRFDASGPQFRAPDKTSNKVVLDERFASVLTDERFQLQVHDKYGRKSKSKHKTAMEELSAFYTIENDNGGSSKQEKTKRNETKNKQKKRDSEASDKMGANHDSHTPASRIAYLTALSRGQIDVSSSSDEDATSNSETSSSDDESDDGHSRTEEGGGVLDPGFAEEQVDITEEPTRYLAVTNMDWTNVRAVDIYALLSSFVATGALIRVRVFLSNFGQEKLETLERLGPTGVWKKNLTKLSQEDDESDAGSHDSDSTGDNVPSKCHEMQQSTSDTADTDFDQEKLRAYEASKLKYYFAVAEFSTCELAEKVYREVDGMEFEHSSAEVDLRAIPESELESVIKDRPMRDEATTLPSNYSPPDFIVSALQQTNVTCTWDLDVDREKTLTKYNSGEQWRALTESDDLKAYLASDMSSDEDELEGEKKEKALLIRKSLGLDADSDEDFLLPESRAVDDGHDNVKSLGETDDEDPDVNEDFGGSDASSIDEKEFTFMPGSKSIDLTTKIKAKLSAGPPAKDLTPWEKYQEKRKIKRQERRQAARAKRSEVIKQETRHPRPTSDQDAEESNKAALELLVAGEEKDDVELDYDINELQRLEKNKCKKLRGSRKRKEELRSENAVGTSFSVDVDDSRFQAVLDGKDDRFGIDPTDSNFKKTSGMTKILREQMRRRKKQRKHESLDASSDVACDDAVEQSSGAKALSAIVMSLKAKHS